MSRHSMLAVLLCASAAVPALAQQGPSVGTVAHCYDDTPFRARIDEEHTSLGGQRSLGVERGRAALAIADGARVTIRGKGGKVTATLWIEQSAPGKLADNKRAVRDHLLWVIDRSGTGRPEHRAGNGIEVMSLEKADVEGPGYISQHNFFHDASGLMVSARIYRQRGPGERDYRTMEEYQRYRNELFGRLVGCLTGTPGLPAVAGPAQ